MEILAHVIDKDWKPLETENASDEGQTSEKVTQLLSNLLLSENLIVLCGLGSTKYLKDSSGNSVGPSMADLWTAAEEKAGDKFQQILASAHYTDSGESKNIEDLLSNCQMVLQLKSDEKVKDFVEQTESTIAKKCRFPSNDESPDVHESFLRKVARRSPRLPRTRIFTTNYDLCFEKAASNSRFIMIDGFSHTYPQEFDGGYFSYDLVKREQDREAPDYITNVFHLYKIHGSVDWENTGKQIIKNINTSKPCLIYPRQGKYQSSYDPPFGEMMSRFQMALRQPNTGLLIIGFGFNDSHLVQPIMSAINTNVSLNLMVVDPNLKNMREGAINNIEKFIQEGDTRLSLLAANFEHFVPLIPDLVAKTEEEMHHLRKRKIQGIQ